MLEQLGDAALQAALDAFTAADTFRTGRLSSRDFCGMLGKLYAAAGAAPLSPKEAAQLFEQADRHCNGHVCFHEARRPVTPRDCRLATTPYGTRVLRRAAARPAALPRPQGRAPALTPEQVLHAWPRIQAVCDAARCHSPLIV